MDNFIIPVNLSFRIPQDLEATRNENRIKILLPLDPETTEHTIDSSYPKTNHYIKIPLDEPKELVDIMNNIDKLPEFFKNKTKSKYLYYYTKDEDKIKKILPADYTIRQFKDGLLIIDIKSLNTNKDDMRDHFKEIIGKIKKSGVLLNTVRFYYRPIADVGEKEESLEITEKDISITI